MIELSRTNYLTAFVCGLPCSGNHVIKAILERGGAETVYIVHGFSRGQIPKLVAKHYRSDFVFVMPVRSDTHWRQAIKKSYATKAPYMFDDIHSYTTQCRDEVMRQACMMNAPIKIVSYEAMIETPNEIARDICEWAGLSFVPFPEYGNGPTGPAQDANDKYRRLPYLDLDGGKRPLRPLMKPELESV